MIDGHAPRRLRMAGYGHVVRWHVIVASNNKCASRGCPKSCDLTNRKHRDRVAEAIENRTDQRVAGSATQRVPAVRRPIVFEPAVGSLAGSIDLYPVKPSVALIDEPDTVEAQEVAGGDRHARVDK